MKRTVACGQFAPQPGDIEANTGVMSALARDAAAAGASLIVLPELCLCGYPGAEEARARAVAADGPQVGALRSCARKERVAIAFGFAEAGPGGALYNSMAFIDGQGSLAAVYRKVHLWATEKSWATPGSSFAAFDALGLRLGMWICYDSRFPEAARCIARAGATLALAGSAWFGPGPEWELALRARAMDNGIFVAGAVLLGASGSAPFHGESMVVDPHGEILAKAAPGRPGIICAEYDTKVVDTFRSRLPLLADLRPESYA